jgi:hypothetical protein
MSKPGASAPPTSVKDQVTLKHHRTHGADMNKQCIATEDFSDAEELARAINQLLDEIGRKEIVYVESNGFLHEGRVFLIEETLTDGSKAYNMAIGEQP